MRGETQKVEVFNVPEKLNERFGKDISVLEISERRFVAVVAPENMVKVCRYVFRDLGARMSTATGIDQRSSVELMYHFSLDAHNMVVSIKTFASKPDCTIDSFGAEVPAAVYIEREISEMLGVTFRNHPDPRHLELPDDWPVGKFPWKRGEL